MNPQVRQCCTRDHITICEFNDQFFYKTEMVSCRCINVYSVIGVLLGMMNHINIGCNHIWIENVVGDLNMDALDDKRMDREINSFHIHKTDITTRLCSDIRTVVTRCNTIENICLMHCNIVDMPEFMSVIVGNSTIRCLNMDHCSDINEINAMCIADKLSGDVHLTRLLLNYTSIDTNGFNHIMKSLTINTTLKELNIHSPNLFARDTTNIIIETVPHIKSLRTFTAYGCVSFNVTKLYNALSKNYSLESFYLCDNLTTFTIQTFSKRNEYIRTQALKQLLNLVISMVPLIRVYKCLDAYCMMWIYEWIHEHNIHVNEFKKINVIRSVFEFYRKKKCREVMSVVS